MKKIIAALNFFRNNQYFRFTEDQIARTIDFLPTLELCLKENIEIVSENEKISFAESERKLVKGEIEYHTLCIKSPIPTIYDIGARFNNWTYSVDDEWIEVKSLFDYYSDRNILIEYSKDKDEFIKSIERKEKKYLQFYIDLCMPMKEDGEALMNKIIATTQNDEIEPLKYYYTQFVDKVRINESKLQNIIPIEKPNRGILKRTIDPLIDNLFKKINTDFNMYPNLPLIEKLIKAA